jgi:hypothetical protein
MFTTTADLHRAIFVAPIDSDAVRFADPAEERALIIKARGRGREADEAALRLLVAYAPALRAGMRAWSSVDAAGATGYVSDVDDARQELMAYTIRAIRDVDLDRYERLAGIAKVYVQEALARMAENITGTTIASRSLQRFWAILRKADGDIARAEAIAPTMSMRADTFRSILGALRGRVSLDDEADGFGEVPGEDNYAALEDVMLAYDALNAMTDDQRDVCEMSYGFTEHEPVADGEIARRRNQHRTTVLRIRNAGLDAARVRLGLTA